MKRLKVLVTGGAGYIGAHTTVELQKTGFEVVIVDNLSNSSEDVIDRIEKITGERPAFFKADCADLSAFSKVMEQVGEVDAAIHFAAYKAVGESVKEPLMYYRNNLQSLINLLQILTSSSKAAVVFSSSCTVYGQPDKENLPVSENAPIKKAESPYGMTKQMCEDILEDTARAFKPNLKVISLRYFNPIGAHESALIGELPRGVPQNLLPFVTQTAIGKRERLSVFGNDYNTPDGSCIRDYIYICDLAKAHVAAIKRMLYESEKMEGNIEFFNLGTGRGLSVLEVINEFEKATGVKVPYIIAPRREGDIEQVWADPSRANEILGWIAETPLDAVMKSAWLWEQQLASDS
ncbi:MAG: UDP-glucose 4-epimerase GalE [Bacteroidetes bacterium GWE2_39_28]|nr:MAG: UDP-glucose 4-epimerase GalE [Bacteroidetes bacterium GWE2_39_28]OFY11674.1 MAG: UDP-glucose 4-epimerase GalE [Bacteroidetes bacterium GWF2_39_10]OFZ06663.1 MAG: UDP-glucose 4-epimerase GalE [Bacteroidetes bacterium RIFOXYB2_FULL_39_7]OFZ11545.1 MAG: UDP-glucose 4-epimerase GalE [Bacteroidetes bacterium RIFOXYC2_FULL_39_11]HCT94725.1 UDP-glucose 4-epimerase GalE [Rikenellaceae bacterium]